MTGKINVTEYVKSMRTDRLNMVQTYVRKTIMSYSINKKLKKRSEVWIKKLKKSKKCTIFTISEWKVCIKSTNILRTQNIRKVFLQEQYKTIFQALHDVFRAPIQSLNISDFVKKVENMSKEEPANWTVIRKEFQVI